MLVGLDISAVFDTVSHKLLLNRLNHVFRIFGRIIDWLLSYLDNCHQYVQLCRHRSPSVLCSSGVPHGPVVSALLFIAYVAPVGDVISSCSMEYHQYADDTQLFIAIRTSTLYSLTFLWVKSKQQPLSSN